MSASPVARQATQCQIIPSKRVLINDPNQLPADYSSTPGGTLYSTTPGVPVTGRLRLEAGQVDLPGTRTLLTNHVREKRPGTRTNSATGSCPGIGTRIVYERAFLMNLRNSPISRTPPRNIPAIPADLLKGTASAISITPSPTSKDIPVIEETPAEQFEMDM